MLIAAGPCKLSGFVTPHKRKEEGSLLEALYNASFYGHQPKQKNKTNKIGRNQVKARKPWFCLDFLQDSWLSCVLLLSPTDPALIPLALPFNWFVFVPVLPGLGTGFAFWASGRRQGWGAAGSSSALKAARDDWWHCKPCCSSHATLPGLAAPWCSVPSSPTHSKALINTRGFPGCLLRHLGVLSFFSPSLYFISSSLWASMEEWRGKNQKESRGANIFSYVLPLLSKSKFCEAW